MRWLLVLACVCGWAASSSAQTTEPDPVAPLLREFEQALNRGDRTALTALFSPDVPSSQIDLYLGSLLMPGAVKSDGPVARPLPVGRGSARRRLQPRRGVLHRDARPRPNSDGRHGYATSAERRPRVVEIRRRRRADVRRRPVQVAHRQASADGAQSGDHVRRPRAADCRRAPSSASSATTG